MPTKLTSKEKKGLTKADRKQLLKKKRAEEHQKLIRGLLGNESQPVIEEKTTSGEVVKKVKEKKVYKDPKKIARVEAAEKRAEQAKDRTPEQQLQLLNERLGDGVGAEKERKRLQLLIEKKATKKIEKVEENTEVKKEGDVVVKPRLKAKERRAKEKKSK